MTHFSKGEKELFSDPGREVCKYRVSEKQEKQLEMEGVKMAVWILKHSDSLTLAS